MQGQKNTLKPLSPYPISPRSEAQIGFEVSFVGRLPLKHTITEAAMHFLIDSK